MPIAFRSLQRSFATHTKKYQQTLMLHIQRNDFCVVIRINSIRKINENLFLFFSPPVPFKPLFLQLVRSHRSQAQVVTPSQVGLLDSRKNLYNYEPSSRVNDCAKYLINGRLLQASISEINQNGRLLSFSKRRMDPCLNNNNNNMTAN